LCSTRLLPRWGLNTLESTGSRVWGSKQNVPREVKRFFSHITTPHVDSKGCRRHELETAPGNISHPAWHGRMRRRLKNRGGRPHATSPQPVSVGIDRELNVSPMLAREVFALTYQRLLRKKGVPRNRSGAAPWALAAARSKRGGAKPGLEERRIRESNARKREHAGMKKLRYGRGTKKKPHPLYLDSQLVKKK